ncbi:ABC transporter permease [Oceanidesulfovibrio indonesiensis]|nr:FtsX-like permease family protein [Oceanidesulfovibrio indonesiensis]
MSIESRMGWRNIWRNPRRSVLTMTAIAFAVALLVFMLAFQMGTYDAMIGNAVAIRTGHMQIQAEKYHDEGKMWQVVEDPAAVADVLDSIPRVAAYTARANGFALLSSEERTYGGMVVGIDPEAEARVSTLKTLIREGEYLEPDDGNQALVGRLLAKNLKIGLGDELVVLGNGRDGSIAAMVYTIKGIYSSGQDEFDRASIQVPLAHFQETFSMRGAVHEIVVLADSLDAAGDVRKELSSTLGEIENEPPLVALSWDELLPGLKESITLDFVSGIIMYLMLTVVVAFSILNTFLMAVFERTREFGVLMALGARPGRLTRLLLIESTFLTLAGLVAGLALGVGVTLFFQSHGIPLGESIRDMVQQYGIPERLYPKLNMVALTVGPGIVLVITFITALFPALKVRSINPVEALPTV